MNDDGKHVEASQRTVCAMQSKAREDVAKMLAMIYSETGTPSCSSRRKSSDTGIKKVAFPGRYVTRVLRVRPFEVAKCFVRPQVTCGNKTHLDADVIVHKLFNTTELQNVLLVITPTVNKSDNHIIHAYAIDKERHLGVTSLTKEEMNVIVYKRKPDSYYVIYCSTYIELEDAFKKSRLRNQIFDVLQNQFPKPIRSWYDGKRITIRYRRSKTGRKLNFHSKNGNRCCKLRSTVEARADSTVLSAKVNPIEVKAKRGPRITMPVPPAETSGNLISRNAIRPRIAWRCTADHHSKLKTSSATRYSSSVTKNKFNIKPLALRGNLPTVLDKNASKPAGTPIIKRSNDQIPNVRCNPMPKTQFKAQMGAYETVQRCTSKPGSRTSSPVRKSRSFVNRSPVVKHSHARVAFGSRNCRPSISLESTNEKSTSANMPLIRNPTHSLLRSRSNFPITNYMRNTVDRARARKPTDPRIAFGGNDSISSRNNDQSTAAPDSSRATSRALTIKQTHEIVRKCFDSPVRNYGLILSNESSVKPSTNSNVTGNGSNSPTNNNFSSVKKNLIKKQTQSVQRSRSDSPLPSSCCRSNKSLAKIRTQSDLNVRNKLPVTSPRRRFVAGTPKEKRTNSPLSKGNVDLRPRTLMAARSVLPKLADTSNGMPPAENQTQLPASNDSIHNLPKPMSKTRSGFVHRAAVAAHCNSAASLKSNASVYTTPMGSGSRSPRTSSSSDSLLRSQTRTHVSNNRGDLNGEADSDSRMTQNCNSQVSIDSNVIQHGVPLSSKTYSQHSIHDAWIEDLSSLGNFGDEMLKSKIPKRQRTVSAASSYYSFPSSPRRLNGALQSDQGMPRRVMPTKPEPNVHGLQGILKNSRSQIYSKQRSILPQAQTLPKSVQMNVNSERLVVPQPQPSRTNNVLKAANKTKSFISEVDKAMLLQRERMWTSSGPNSKRRVNFQSDVLTNTKVVKKVQRKVAPKKVQCKEVPMNVPIKNDVKKESKHAVKSDGIKVLWKPHPLSESVGEIYVPTKVSKLKFEDSQTIIRASSSYFNKLMDPLRVPANFSQRATEKLQTRLNRMTAKQAFENLGRLVERINARAIPHNRQLITFFRIAELLDIKLFVRSECHWPDTSPTIDPRCRVDSYMFDDRKDFIVSLGMLHKQLVQFSKMFPGIKPNIRYIDNALELTMLPSLITRCIKSVMVSLRARGLFDLLAEITYELVHPQPGALITPRQTPRLQARVESRIEDSEAMRKVLELEEAVRQLKMKHLSTHCRYT